jgi:hypothetical protein
MAPVQEWKAFCEKKKILLYYDNNSYYLNNFKLFRCIILANRIYTKIILRHFKNELML